MCLPSCKDLKLGLSGYVCDREYQNRHLTKVEVFDIACTFKSQIQKCKCCGNDVEPGRKNYCIQCSSAIDEVG